MIRRCLALSAVALCSAVVSMAQVSSEVKVDKLERWWGASSAYASQMPYENSVESLPVVSNREFSAPFLVSNSGRYIIFDEKCSWSFGGSAFYFDGQSEIKVAKSGRNLREAYIVAVNRGLTLSEAMAMPADDFFRGVVYNFSGTIDEALDFAKSTTAGVIVLSESWQSDYGALDFSNPAAKDIISEIHSLGFQVVLSVEDYVSPDSKYFREFRDRGFLVIEEDKKPLIEQWKSGYSALLNLNDSIVVDFMHTRLKNLQSTYGVDGFNVNKEELVQGMNYSMVEGSTVGCGINKNVQEITFRRGLSWEELSGVVAKTLSAAIVSYPYTTFDMTQSRAKCDEELFIRALQAMVMMPVMQISVSELEGLSEANRAIADKMIALRNEVAPYILKLAQEAASSGEPIVRMMEYNCPKSGFWDCTDQFMLGTEYIVAPILSKDNKRIVRLPRGRWTDDRGKTFKGPAVMEIEAGLDRLPYFKRK